MRRLLLVEDEPDARGSLERGLARAGFECIGVGTLEEAKNRARSSFFDVAVVDVVLGENQRAGLALLPELTALSHRPPVVVITAYADLGKVKDALNAGAAYLLEKPFSVAELVAVIQRVLGQAESPGHFVDRALARAGLTDKELSIARLVLKGLPSQEIARLENNSDKTIRQHLTQIYAKCGVSSRAEFFHYVFPS
ncbi:MAG: response regulator [Polyangiales bacterium]